MAQAAAGEEVKQLALRFPLVLTGRSVFSRSALLQIDGYTVLPQARLLHFVPGGARRCRPSTWTRQQGGTRIVGLPPNR